MIFSCLCMLYLGRYVYRQPIDRGPSLDWTTGFTIAGDIGIASFWLSGSPLAKFLRCPTLTVIIGRRTGGEQQTQQTTSYGVTAWLIESLEPTLKVEMLALSERTERKLKPSAKATQIPWTRVIICRRSKACDNMRHTYATHASRQSASIDY